MNNDYSPFNIPETKQWEEHSALGSPEILIMLSSSLHKLQTTT